MSQRRVPQSSVSGLLTRAALRPQIRSDPGVAREQIAWKKGITRSQSLGFGFSSLCRPGLRNSFCSICCAALSQIPPKRSPIQLSSKSVAVQPVGLTRKASPTVFSESGDPRSQAPNREDLGEVQATQGGKTSWPGGIGPGLLRTERPRKDQPEPSCLGTWEVLVRAKGNSGCRKSTEQPTNLRNWNSRAQSSAAEAGPKG